MKPPYDITSTVLKLISSISIKLGEINAYYLHKQTPQLRKQNKIRTIHATLGIEGNALTQEQISAILDNKRVVGPPKDVQEVLNAIAVYDIVEKLNPYSSKSFLFAHNLMMQGLVKEAGKYRKQSVGIAKGKKITHLAPPHENVPHLMEELFDYIKLEEESILIKSCVFHYEMEFIHPFADGNGRMGRLWQSLILMQEFPVFQFLHVETLIKENQREYYKALSKSDKSGKSSAFLEFMLSTINKALGELLTLNGQIFDGVRRLEYFIQLNKSDFTRKEYMNVFKNISSSTASRDLQKGTEQKILKKMGEKNKTVYRII